MFRFAYFSYEYREVDYQQNAFLFTEKLLNRTFCVAVKLVVHGLICTDLEESSWTMRRNCVNHAPRLAAAGARRQPIENGPQNFLDVSNKVNYSAYRL